MCLLERISLKLLSSNQNRLSLVWTSSVLLFSHHQFPLRVERRKQIIEPFSQGWMGEDAFF